MLGSSLLAIALLVGWPATPAVAQMSTAQACAALGGEVDKLGLRYVQALEALRRAIDAHEAAEAEAATAIAEQRRRIDWVLDQDVVTGSFVREITVFVSLAEIQGLQDQVRRHQRQMEQAAAEAALLERTLLAVTTFMDQACDGVASSAAAAADTDSQPAATDTAATPIAATATDNTPPAATTVAATPLPIEGFWSDSRGRFYFASGGAFHRLDDGSVALSLSCNGGRGTNLVGVEGELCEGQFFNREGKVEGVYEGVYRVRESDGRTRIDGFYGWSGDAGRYDWNLSALSDAEVAQEGLTYNPH